MKEIIQDVKGSVGPGLMGNLGLTAEQVDRGLDLAGQVTREVLQTAVSDDPRVAWSGNSMDQVTQESHMIWDRVGATYVGSLTKEMGLKLLHAVAMKNAVVPGMARSLAEHALQGEEKVEALLSEAA